LEKNNFIRTEAHFCSKFKSKLHTIFASAEEQSLKFSIAAVNKAAASAAQLANCILFHAYSCTVQLQVLQLSAAQAQTKISLKHI